MSFWNKKIINTDIHFFGLDISDFSMKGIEINKCGSHDKITGYFLTNFPKKLVSAGKIIDKNQLKQKLHDIRKNKYIKINTNKVVCSLPEEKSFLRLIQIPKIKENNKIKEVIRWELENDIPLSVEEVYFDFYVLPEKLQFNKMQLNKDQSINVLVLAVSKKIIDDLMEVLNDVGLEIVGLESESFALTRSLLGKEDINKTSLIIDIGGNKTSFLFVVNGILLFTASIYISAQTFTDRISKGLNMSINEAEKLKISHGIGSMIKRDPLFSVLEDTLNGLSDEIQKSIDFFIEKLQYAKKIDQIILCGGGASTKGLIPFLAKKLGYPTFLGNPWKNVYLGKTIPPMKREESTEYATAIGLALKKIDVKNFLNEIL